MPRQQTQSIDPDGLEDYFTDVKELRNFFRDTLFTPTLSKRLLIIHGVGGVGKSSLLRMFRLYCKSKHIPVGLSSGDEAKSPANVLVDWMSDLRIDGIKLTAFSKTLENFRSIQAKVNEQARKKQERMEKVAVKTIETAASMIPVIGPLVGGLGGVGAEALVDWLRGFLSKSDINLLLDPTDKLTKDFLEDIGRVAPQQRLVLMMDTFEQLTAMEDWLRNLVQQLHPNVLIVIAGRSVPNWGRQWPGWLAQTQFEELKPMTDDVMRELAQRYYATIQHGKPDPKQVEAIIKFSRGLPLAVAGAVKLWIQYNVEDFQAVKPQVVADLVDRLMEGVPEDMRPILEAAAAVRWFNMDILQSVTDQANISTTYDELRRFPFMRPRAEGLALHDTVREMLDENLKVHYPNRHRELHEKAAKYFEALIEKDSGEDAERLGLERLYHRISSDEETGILLFQEMAEELVRYRFNDRFRALISDISTYSLKQQNSKHWQEYYRARLLQIDYCAPRAAAIYEQLHKVRSLNPQLHALILLSWIEILVGFEYITQPGGFRKALTILEECERVLPEQDPNRFLLPISRARIYRRRVDGFSQVNHDLRSAIRLCKEQKNFYGLVLAYEELRHAYLDQGAWKNIIETQEQALLDVPEQNTPKSLRARLIAGWKAAWVLMGFYKETEQVLWNIHEIDSQLGYPRIKQGTHPRDLLLAIGVQKRESEVDDYFADAVNINRLTKDETNAEASLAWDLGFWGITKFKCGKIEAAETLINDALVISERLTLDQSMFWNYWLGMCSLATNKWENANAFFDQCCSLSKTERMFIARCYFECGALTGLVCVKHAQGDYATIPSLLIEAEQLAQQYEYNDHLASLRLTQGHIAWDGHILEWGSGFDAALHYYQHALIHALRYNRFMLDEVLWGGGICTPLRPIIPHCLGRGKEGLRLLTALRDWWQTGANDIGTMRPDTISPIPEGIPLLEAERIARQREPGDGAPQKSVIEQIEAALVSTAASSKD